MRITFLGTGTSHGIPMIGCDCAVCRSDDPHNKRLRPSVFLELGGQNVLIDATPDFRTQALRTGIKKVDAVLMTHTHADHALGLDDLRVFCVYAGKKMPIYGSTLSLESIRRVFPYACTEKPEWQGLPSFELHELQPHQVFELSGATMRAVPLPHGRMTVFGYVVGKELAYITDCKRVPDDVLEVIRGVKVLVLDALRDREHPTHLTIDEAIVVAKEVGAETTLFTHMCHDVDHETVEKRLPGGVRLAYDGMQIEVVDGVVRHIA